MEVAGRMQMNFLLAPYAEYVSLYENVPRIFMPVFWVESKFSMDSDKANQLKYGLNIPQFAQIFGVLLVSLGIFITIYRYCKEMCRMNTEKSNNNNNDITVIRDVEKPLMSTDEILIVHKN